MIENEAALPPAFDPDHTLGRMREHLDAAGEARREAEVDPDAWARFDQFAEVVIECAAALDQWMSGGNQPPSAWTRPRL